MIDSEKYIFNIVMKMEQIDITSSIRMYLNTYLKRYIYKRCTSCSVQQMV